MCSRDQCKHEHYCTDNINFNANSTNQIINDFYLFSATTQLNLQENSVLSKATIFLESSQLKKLLFVHIAIRKHLSMMCVGPCDLAASVEVASTTQHQCTTSRKVPLYPRRSYFCEELKRNFYHKFFFLIIFINSSYESVALFNSMQVVKYV